MRSEISERILRVALRIAGTKVHFDQFIDDTVNAHIGLLQASDNLDSVLSLLGRSGSKEAQQRLELVRQNVNAALEVLRTLDALYSSGKLSFGPRAPQARGPKTFKNEIRDLEASQERPTWDRATRKMFQPA